MELAEIINWVCTLNKEPPPPELNYSDGMFTGWSFWLEDIPTIHLKPILAYIRRTKKDSYKLSPADFIAVWNNRYEEDEGPPPEGMSWERDENGQFTIPYGQNPKTGLWSFGCGIKEEAVKKNTEARDAWLASHGLTWEPGMKVTAENKEALLRMAKEKKDGNV